eukprot:TRINITY_DN5616_c0_g1_i1.p1 TRINITY_DN5616_c0_g1~~TRINITY_DN5616_c0_g1_i1.p1  ORF type:complete len:265 (-),score=48.14 TRINITY_DN5616_c0_g1_i1:80-847(-)
MNSRLALPLLVALLLLSVSWAKIVYNREKAGNAAPLGQPLEVDMDIWTEAWELHRARSDQDATILLNEAIEDHLDYQEFPPLEYFRLLAFIYYDCLDCSPSPLTGKCVNKMNYLIDWGMDIAHKFHDSEVLYWLGRAYERQKRFDSSEKIFAAIHQMGENYAPAEALYALTLEVAGQSNQSTAETLDSFVSGAPQTADDCLVQARIHKWYGSDVEAVRALEQYSKFPVSEQQSEFYEELLTNLRSGQFPYKQLAW